MYRPWFDGTMSSWLRWLGLGALTTGGIVIAKEVGATETHRNPIPRAGPDPFPPLAPSTTYLDGIDVSIAQGDKINWSVARDDAKLSFAIAKTSQGARGKPKGYTDAAWINNRAGMRAALAAWGGYHYGIFSQSAIEQADFMCSQIGEPDDRMLPPSLDAEWIYNDGKIAGFPKPSKSQVIDFMYGWDERVKQNIGRRSIIYTNAGFWNFIGDPIDPIQKAFALWVAVWTSAAAPGLPRGWDRFDVWQYSAEAGPLAGKQIKGIPGKSVDRDRFKGSLESMYAFIRSSKV